MLEPSLNVMVASLIVYLMTGDTFTIGKLHAPRNAHTGPHNLPVWTYLIGDTAFIGDTLFMPDYGTARADFPGGDARSLYRSIQRIYSLPESTRLFLCHDYKPADRDEYIWETTVAEQACQQCSCQRWHVGGRFRCHA